VFSSTVADVNDYCLRLTNCCPGSLNLSLILRPTVSRPVCLGTKHTSGAYDQIFISQTVAGLLMWGALSDKRTGVSFKIAPDPRQRSHFRVRVPCDSRPNFSVSGSRLPFSSPPTTRRVTVEVFDPASTWECSPSPVMSPFITSGEQDRTHRLQGFHYCCSCMRCVGNVCNSTVTL
jgi:hypothetical protein